MFEKIQAIEKEIQEMEVFIQCGIYRIARGQQIIFTIDRIKILKNALIIETARAKAEFYRK